MHFHALRHQAQTAFGATTTENVPTIFGGHAFTETELLFTSPLRGLIGAFGHKRWGREPQQEHNLAGEREAEPRETPCRVNQ